MKKAKELMPFIAVIAGFFTLGLTDLIWMYILSDKINRRRFPPIKQLALTLLTLGIYGIFWTYMLSGELYDTTELRRMKCICTVLTTVFLRNISIAIMLKRTNVIEEKGLEI